MSSARPLVGRHSGPVLAVAFKGRKTGRFRVVSIDQTGRGKSMKLIAQGEKSHVWQDAVEEFEDAVLSDCRVHKARPLGSREAKIVHFVFRPRFFRALNAFREAIAGPRDPTGCDQFVVMMGFEPLRCVPDFYLPGRKSFYMFDAWPVLYDSIATFVRRWNIRQAFVSSSQAAVALADLIPQCQFSWVPEGIDPRLYRYWPHAERDIDVVQIGRKHDSYHERVVGPLAEKGRVYRYARVKGELVFATRDDFILGMARSRVSICFPCNLTNPRRSGNTETMTQRYLQSFASKCLVVGHAPEEMVRLFGYNPVVEADADDPSGQLLSVLDQFDSYLPLIEENYRVVREDHSWARRWETIAGLLLPAIERG
jgi:hypothetical protein